LLFHACPHTNGCTSKRNCCQTQVRNFKSGLLSATNKEYGYPSGEALIVSAGAAVALILFRNTLRQFIVSIILAKEAALVCISRVYVGGHYPLDIIGGILLGVDVSHIFVGIE